MGLLLTTACYDDNTFFSTLTAAVCERTFACSEDGIEHRTDWETEADCAHDIARDVERLFLDAYGLDACRDINRELADLCLNEMADLDCDAWGWTDDVPYPAPCEYVCSE